MKKIPLALCLLVCAALRLSAQASVDDVLICNLLWNNRAEASLLSELNLTPPATMDESIALYAGYLSDLAGGGLPEDAAARELLFGECAWFVSFVMPRWGEKLSLSDSAQRAYMDEALSAGAGGQALRLMLFLCEAAPPLDVLRAPLDALFALLPQSAPNEKPLPLLTGYVQAIARAERLFPSSFSVEKAQTPAETGNGAAAETPAETADVGNAAETSADAAAGDGAQVAAETVDAAGEQVPAETAGAEVQVLDEAGEAAITDTELLEHDLALAYIVSHIDRWKDTEIAAEGGSLFDGAFESYRDFADGALLVCAEYGVPLERLLLPASCTVYEALQQTDFSFTLFSSDTIAELQHELSFISLSVPVFAPRRAALLRRPPVLVEKDDVHNEIEGGSRGAQ